MSSEIDKTYLYKISKSGVYLGNLPSVDSEFGYNQNINTGGVQLSITVGQTSESTDANGVALIGATNSLIRNNNTIEIVEVSTTYPTGKTVFTGFISKWRGNFGSSDDIIVTCVGYGDDLDNYVVTTGQSTDQTQTSQNSTTDFGGDGDTFIAFYQSFQTGVGVTDISSVDLMLRKVAGKDPQGGVVYVYIYASEADARAETNLLGSSFNSTLYSDTTDSAMVVNFVFAGGITVTASTTYYLKVRTSAQAPDYDGVYQISFSTANPYGSGLVRSEYQAINISSYSTPTSTPGPGSFNDWTNPSNAYTENGTFATILENPTNFTQDYGTFGGFGLSFPSNTVITGIEVVVKAMSSGVTSDLRVQLLDLARSTSSDIKSQLLTPINTQWTYGGSGDKWNWPSVDGASTTDANLVVRLSAPSGNSNTVSVDGIKVRIYYRETYNIGGDDLYFRTYKSGGGVNSPYTTEDPTDILTDVIDNYVAQGGVVNYGSGTFDATSTSVDYTFRLNTTLEAIKQCLTLAPFDWYWYVNPATQIIYFKQTATTAAHTMVLGKHISNLDLEATVENIRNVVYVSGGDDGSGDNILVLRTNTTSILDTGRQLLDRISDSNIRDVPTGQTVGDNFLDQNDSETYQSPLTIQAAAYDITLFNPGDVIGFGNFNSFIDSLLLQIVAINRSPDSVDLTLGVLPPTTQAKIEANKRAVIKLQTENNPSSPT